MIKKIVGIELVKKSLHVYIETLQKWTGSWTHGLDHKANNILLLVYFYKKTNALLAIIENNIILLLKDIRGCVH